VNQVDALAARYGLPTWRIQRLLDRYGSLVDEVLAPGLSDPALLAPLAAADEYLAAEIRYGVTHEGALHLDDLLTRRTRISIETVHRGTDCAPEVAGLVADVLGWDRERVAAEVDVYLSRVQAERESQTKLDDQSADAARLVGSDTRAVDVGRALG
jgi:glycerol-3-phosphate dehydrogenase